MINQIKGYDASSPAALQGETSGEPLAVPTSLQSPPIASTSGGTVTSELTPSLGSLQCQQCGKLFTCKSALLRHEVVHTGARDYKCKHCDKTFAQTSNLNYHVRTVHDKVKAYNCDVCHKQFAQRGSLATHVASVHEKLKPYKCSECGKEFALNHQLARHKLVHSGDKPYKCKPHKCEECGKTFAQSSHLSDHKLTHSGVKAHKCSDCGKTFTQRRTLSSH